jgi:hypothetical protein
MFDLIGEVFECAERNTLFWRINYICVADRRVRYDDLGVAFGAESATFKQRFLKPNALTIDILPSFYVINCVDYKRKVIPEIVIKNNFVFLTDSKLEGLEMYVWIDDFSHLTGGLTLVLAYVMLAEQKLPI